ncbi:hypothetical protein [Cellulosilyticum sp. I15G10I2]|uniref:hypothetical protein n=1 Tax=Cellulosilyticum sp. I15G10I2 TaxID=1892843 RepID=UPI00085C745C|nr:hypothetical protein [Cellulosilyticum sp. I15G10I2]
MSSAGILDLLKEYLEENVANKIKLQLADDNNIANYKLVNPNVFVGWIPPKGYLPTDVEQHIPCIVVGLDDGSDNSDYTTFSIRLSFAIFSPGDHTPNESGNIKYIPSFNGYRDLLNFIDLTKAALISDTIIKSKMKLQDNVKWKMYEEQPYPYWYGYMTFEVSTKAYPKKEIEKLL